LKLNLFSEKILKGLATLKLVPYEVIKERQEEQKKKAQNSPEETLNSNPTLYEHLRLLRKDIAGKIGKPAFVVFSNASLMDMSSKAPNNIDEFLQVNGVGAHKAKKYGKAFLGAIKSFNEMGK
ncbi:HRDC domain-containing protein, partial [Aureispira]|nr:HRDC domain-containing protein [Aureispira sp.]